MPSGRVKDSNLWQGGRWRGRQSFEMYLLLNVFIVTMSCVCKSGDLVMYETRWQCHQEPGGKVCLHGAALIPTFEGLRWVT